MAVIPAQIQSVNSSYTDPNYQNPFLSAVNAGLQGYFAKKNLPEELIKSAFPNFVATKQIRQAQPGEQTILPNIPWAWKDSANLSDFKDWISIQNTMDLIKNRNKPPTFTYGNAATALLSGFDGMNALDRPSLETAMKMKGLVEAVNTVSQPDDPIMAAIKKAKADGMTDDEIRANLEEEGITPSDYGY